MNTIRITHAKPLGRNEFQTYEDLMDYLLENDELTLFEPLPAKEVTKERQQRFEKALRTPKSELLNL